MINKLHRPVTWNTSGSSCLLSLLVWWTARRRRKIWRIGAFKVIFSLTKTVFQKGFSQQNKAKPLKISRPSADFGHFMNMPPLVFDSRLTRGGHIHKGGHIHRNSPDGGNLRRSASCKTQIFTRYTVRGRGAKRRTSSVFSRGISKGPHHVPRTSLQEHWFELESMPGYGLFRTATFLLTSR